MGSGVGPGPQGFRREKGLSLLTVWVRTYTVVHPGGGRGVTTHAAGTVRYPSSRLVWERGIRSLSSSTTSVPGGPIPVDSFPFLLRRPLSASRSRGSPVSERLRSWSRGIQTPGPKVERGRNCRVDSQICAPTPTVLPKWTTTPSRFRTRHVGPFGSLSTALVRPRLRRPTHLRQGSGSRRRVVR